MSILSRVISFGFVSLVGLMLDLSIFATALTLGLGVFAANVVGGGCAVTFVYFVSVRRIFAYRGGFLFRLFWAYACYQVIGIALASLAVASLVVLGVGPLVAKLAILPVTFAANYLFMSLLTRNTAAWSRQRGAS